MPSTSIADSYVENYLQLTVCRCAGVAGHGDVCPYRRRRFAGHRRRRSKSPVPDPRGGLDRLVEPFGKVALARQRAMPFAAVVGEAAELPLRQFEVEQRQRRIGPGARSGSAVRAAR